MCWYTVGQQKHLVAVKPMVVSGHAQPCRGSLVGCGRRLGRRLGRSWLSVRTAMRVCEPQSRPGLRAGSWLGGRPCLGHEHEQEAFPRHVNLNCGAETCGRVQTLCLIGSPGSRPARCGVDQSMALQTSQFRCFQVSLDRIRGAVHNHLPDLEFFQDLPRLPRLPLPKR